MTPIDEVYMVSEESTLSFTLLREIFISGFSRIPVYSGTRGNITGMLFVKDLIFIDPEDAVPVKSFQKIFLRNIERVWDDDNLGDVLSMFKKGRGHLALVQTVEEHEDRDNTYEIIGLVTLEDIVEEILGDEIVDETDRFVHIERRDLVGRAEFDLGRLSLLDSKLDQGQLSTAEINAVTAHLCMNYSQFQTTADGERVDPEKVRKLLSQITAVTFNREGSGDTGADASRNDTLYCRGREATKLTLVLSGKISVLSGMDGFRSDAG